MTTRYLVRTPVADLRKEPDRAKPNARRDPLQETQLLLGECVVGVYEEDGWVRVEAPEQPFCNADGNWSGYGGWVERDQLVEKELALVPDIAVTVPWITIFSEPSLDSFPITRLSFGTRLPLLDRHHGWISVSLPTIENGWLPERAADPYLSVEQLCSRLLGAPYTWGGRSAFYPGTSGLTSVDCSGLVQLIHRIRGLDLPRNARDQFTACKPISGTDLRPGDLIFMDGEQSTGTIDHVMIYVGDDAVFEARGSLDEVVRVSLNERLGVSAKELKESQDTAAGRVCLGRP